MLTLSFDQFYFYWFCLESLLLFLTIKLAFITLERGTVWVRAHQCKPKWLPSPITSPPSQPLWCIPPSFQNPDSHHTAHLIWHQLPSHHQICLCVKLISLVFVFYIICLGSASMRHISMSEQGNFLTAWQNFVKQKIITIMVIKTVIVTTAAAKD